MAELLLSNLPSPSLKTNKPSNKNNQTMMMTMTKQKNKKKGKMKKAQGCGRGNWTIVLSSSLVGLLTGIGIVLFNYFDHEIHDAFWGGMLQRGASWLGEKFMGDTWKQVILVPASTGLIVAILIMLRDAFEDGPQDKNGNEQGGEK